MDFNNLKSLSLAELRQLAISQGMTPHHKAKEATLIRQIIEHATTPPVQTQPMKHVAELPVANKMNTEEEILTACKPFIDKEGFKHTFTDQTWHFHYRGAEDSGHLSVPLRVIRMKAETVARGARFMSTVKNLDGQDVLMVG